MPQVQYFGSKIFRNEAEIFFIDSLESSQYYGAAQLPEHTTKLSDTLVDFADLTF